MARIFLSPPHMGGNELPLIQEAFASNYISSVGPMLQRFEEVFAAYTGIPHNVAVSSGTAALHLALRVMGIGAEDTVYASTLTFIGGAAPILYQGAQPVFIDSDAATWTMDPHLLEKALREDAQKGTLPKAVITVDLYGQSCDLDTILAICSPYNIPVICDSAEAVGARYKDRHCGDGALFAIYSFNGNKIITTSGGGMLASHNKELIEQASFLSKQAREHAAHYEHITYGYNYRMSNIIAAIGCGQMEVLQERVEKHRSIFAYYKDALGGVAGIGFMPQASYGKSNCWLTVITIDPQVFGATHEDVRLALEAQDIESRPVWKPMHLQPVFKHFRAVENGVSESLFNCGLCLPSGSAMTDTDLDRVISIIRGMKK